IIEDTQDHVEVLRAMLEDDFEIISFGSCGAALAALETFPPHLLLMDIGMAHIDGVQCLDRIRAMSQFSQTPAIAITAYAFPEDKERCLSAGFQAVVVKPMIDQTQVRKLIDRLLSAAGGA